MRLNEYAEASPLAAVPETAPAHGPISERISDQDRYSRQVLFPGIGAHGQQRLAASHVAIVGCGATGAASASLLARAGVGTLTIIDRDFVEPSNLQRQVLFDEADARDSLPKAEAARRHIARFNSSIAVHARIADLTPTNIAELLQPSSTTTAPIHLILDATDNFETRYLLNDFAVQQSIPWIYAAAIGAYAATMNILSAGFQPTTNNQQPATFMVQVAAVSSQDVADILLASLQKKGYSVAARHEPQDNLLHVQIGPFAHRADAEAMRQRILADGFNAIVK
jgi:molybdopterin/thiamine biosynthesis adenylyltransferase